MELYDLYCKFPRISTDSRQVVAGGIFFALHGGNVRRQPLCGGGGRSRSGGGGHRRPGGNGRNVRDGKGELFRRTRYAESIAGTGRTPPPATGDSDPRDYGQQRKNDDQRTDQPDAETEIPRSGHAGNFNNHIGVPLTLLAMDRSAEFGVVEMGASHCGERSRCCARSHNPISD